MSTIERKSEPGEVNAISDGEGEKTREENAEEQGLIVVETLGTKRPGS